MVMEDNLTAHNEYVSKEPYDGRTPSKQLVVIEHIANTLYYLFGVTTPNVYIIRDKNDKPKIMSQILTGYKDFSDFMGGTSFLKSLSTIDEASDEETIQKRVDFFNASLKVKGVRIIGREALLIASILLNDMDVLGRGLDNIGLVPTSKPDTLQLVKIDQADAKMMTNLDDFKASLDPELALLSKDYASNLLNLGRNIFGPLHYREFFDGLDRNKVLLSIDIIRAIPDSEITKHVCRNEYLEFVDRDFLKKIADTIIQRKNYITSLFEKHADIAERRAFVSTFFRPASHFSKPMRKISKGASKTEVTIEEVPLKEYPRGLETSL
jgi:hypothetical protein